MRVETVKRVVAGDREVERCEIVLPVKGWASLRLLRREVRWVGLPKAQKLHDADGAIWIDVREGRGRAEKGTIPGAWSVPMKAVFDYGIVAALGTDLIHEIL